MMSELTAFTSSAILLLLIIVLGVFGRRRPILGRRMVILLLALLVQLASDTAAYFDLPMPELASQGLIALLLAALLVRLLRQIRSYLLGRGSRGCRSGAFHGQWLVGGRCACA